MWSLFTKQFSKYFHSTRSLEVKNNGLAQKRALFLPLSIHGKQALATIDSIAKLTSKSDIFHPTSDQTNRENS
jgi:hypothetical protein